MSQQGKVKQNDVSKPAADTPKQINWNAMEAAPLGVPVRLKRPDGTVAICYYHATRKLKDGRWQKAGYWTELFGPRQAILWEPQGWVWQ